MRIRIFKRDNGTRDVVIDKLRTRIPVPPVAVVGAKELRKGTLDDLISDAYAVQDGVSIGSE